MSKKQKLEAGPAPAERNTPPATGSARLRAAVVRFQRFMRAEAGHNPEAPEPASDWEHSINERLLAVEQKLASQNRLLLFSFVAIIADVVAKVVAR